MLLRSKVIPHHSPPTWFHSLAKKGWRSQESKVTWASSWIWDTWLQNLMRSTIGTHQILVLRITGRAYGKKLLQFQVEGAAYCTAVEFAHQPETCENTYTMVRVTQGMSLLSRSILWSTCLTWILAWDSSHLFTVASISLWDLFTNTLILVILFLLLAQHAVPVWVRSLRFCSHMIFAGILQSRSTGELDGGPFGSQSIPLNLARRKLAIILCLWLQR